MSTGDNKKSRVFISRRELLASLAALGFPVDLTFRETTAKEGFTNTVPSLKTRLDKAYELRVKAAEFEREFPSEEHEVNGDEQLYQNKIASFSKGLPHNKLGEVDQKAFQIFLEALNSGEPYAMERIPLGGYAKLSNPQAAWAFDLIGPDCCQVTMPPPPSFGTAEQAGEMCEMYWHSLAADVPFSEYETNAAIHTACEDLSRLSVFYGPKNKGRITPFTIFRADSEGCLKGPYLSQFLLRDIPLSPIRAPQKIRTTLPALSYVTSHDEWLAIQNGKLAGVNEFDPQPRWIRNGRDLGEYVHRDFTYQAFVCAALMLTNMGAPPDGGNPYKYSRTQSGFVTYGAPFVFQLIAIVTTATLKATWFQKWLVHRKLRPEEFGGRVHHHMTKTAKYPIHYDLLNSNSVDAIFETNRTYLLPLAYPEGCPMHPSYPAGHAAIAGACVTVLKALFDESYVIPNPVVASADGLLLVPYEGPDLTIGGEIDKLASNIAIGRDFAGVHWRSDSIEGIKLGEEVAIRVLQEMKLTGNELFAGFSLTRFDGRKITI